MQDLGTIPAGFGLTPSKFGLSKLGMSEKTGNNDGAPAELFARGRREPWCAHFVVWCFWMCGLFLPGYVKPSKTQINPIALVSRMHSECVAAGLMIDGEPEPDDIVFFNTRGDSDPAPGGWHVGIVVSVKRERDGKLWITTVEGNKSNKVGGGRYLADDARIVGYARHPYFARLRDIAPTL